MEATALSYDHLMYMHGVCNARGVAIMSTVLQSEDAEMACLDLQLKVVLDYCMFLAAATGGINTDNFQQVMEDYIAAAEGIFTEHGRLRTVDDGAEMDSFVRNVVMPLQRFLLGSDERDVPREYFAVLEKLLRVYG